MKDEVIEETFFLMYHLRMAREVILKLSDSERKWLIDGIIRSKKHDRNQREGP